MYYTIKKESEKEAILKHVLNLIEQMTKKQREEFEIPTMVSDYGRHWRYTPKPKTPAIVSCEGYDLYLNYSIARKPFSVPGETGTRLFSTVIVDCSKAVLSNI